MLQLSLAALKPAAIARGILMKSKFKAALPSVRGDAGKLRQVFGNLISNSIKFTPTAAASPSPPKPWRTAVSACLNRSLLRGVPHLLAMLPHC